MIMLEDYLGWRMNLLAVHMVRGAFWEFLYYADELGLLKCNLVGFGVSWYQ